MTEFEDPFDRIGGHIALDFVNTVDNRASRARARERLASADDVASWARGAGCDALTAETRLRSLLGSDPDALGRIWRAREALHQAFLAKASSRRVSQDCLNELDRQIRACRRHRKLGLRHGVIQWQWADTAAGADRLLLPVLEAALDLLLAPQDIRIKECEGPGCGWLFLDRSRSGRRRWCSMEDCGNKAKARRHYQRRQESE